MITGLKRRIERLECRRTMAATWFVQMPCSRILPPGPRNRLIIHAMQYSKRLLVWSYEIASDSDCLPLVDDGLPFELGGQADLFFTADRLPREPSLFRGAAVYQLSQCDRRCTVGHGRATERGPTPAANELEGLRALLDLLHGEVIEGRPCFRTPSRRSQELAKQ
jgi:hypothetical protein